MHMGTHMCTHTHAHICIHSHSVSAPNLSFPKDQLFLLTHAMKDRVS